MPLESRERPALGALGWLMARDGNLTFGGGTATIEALRRALVRRGWLTNETHALLYGVSRLTPGTNLLAYCAAAGWTVRGGRGAMVALVGASLPAAAIATLVTITFERLAASPLATRILTIGTGVALIFLFASAWHLARPYLARRAWPRTIPIVVVTLALFAAGIEPVYILLIGAGVGALLVRPT